MTQHTPEPWGYTQSTVYTSIRNSSGELIADTCFSSCNGDASLGEANARRIVACVNACAGVETEVLEGVGYGGDPDDSEIISNLMEQRDGLQAQVDELLEALKTIGMHTITDEDGGEIEVLFGNIGKVRDAIAKHTGEPK